MVKQTEVTGHDAVVDARNTFCPMPVIQAFQAIKTLSAGKVLKVLATDPGSKADFPAWAESTGNHLLRHEEKDGTFTYWIQKA